MYSWGRATAEPVARPRVISDGGMMRNDRERR